MHSFIRCRNCKQRVKKIVLLKISHELRLLANRIRGFLGLMGPLIIAVGILMAYICGAFIEYRSIPYCFLGFPVLFLIVMYFTPETPHTLLRRKHIQESKLFNITVRESQNCE